MHHGDVSNIPLRVGNVEADHTARDLQADNAHCHVSLGHWQTKHCYYAIGLWHAHWHRPTHATGTLKGSRCTGEMPPARACGDSNVSKSLSGIFGALRSAAMAGPGWINGKSSHCDQTATVSLSLCVAVTEARLSNSSSLTSGVYYRPGPGPPGRSGHTAK